ncbi:cytoskeleton-associated protein 5-like isoform X2 [Acanthaster planci]|uniref:Cytoskeleton-associated protein 5-like isoform X2 n=1 Tax=Acanthaster planci TaxID=133434 RepID=A0A8B7Y7F9_ACAPL|nr:cytoskeleton-associated protein 5-like isoform X2 [Acanthaster planci]
MADDTEYLKLPVEEQCVHKVWKARLHGYEEAVKVFNRITDEKSPEFSKYAGLLKKFVTDANAVAQEKGLDAVLAFLETAALAPRTCGEVVSAVVLKCLNSSRTKTREKASEIIMVYIELEKQEVVMEELLKGFTNKQPKIVTACCQLIREAIRDFGSKVIALKPVVKAFPKLLEHSDKSVREEAKSLAVELYRWISNALKPCLSNIKPVQLKELEEEFEKLPSKPPKQTRFLKSQQDLKAAAQAAGDEDEEEEDEEDVVDGGPAVDPYDLLTAVDILSKMPKDFYDNMEEKKWQIRKEALEALLPLVSNPKIEPGDFADLVRSLKKTIAKDTNVMIVALAAKCLTGLANGIRKKFSPYAASCMSTILDKFKEKKISVVTALRDASDAIFPSTSLQNILDDVTGALENKNPSIRAETALFLSRALRICTVSMLPKAVLKPLCTLLVKKLADTFPEVRDGASLALATAQKVVGEKPMQPFFNDLDKIKIDKINECGEKVELNNGTAPKKASKPKAEKKPEPKKKEEPAKAPAAKKAGARPKSASAKSDAAKPGAKKGAKKKALPSDGAREMESEPLLSEEDVLERATAVLSAPVIQQLESANWKERLAAMEEFTTKVHNMDKESINTQVLIRIMCRKPGWKEANFQVLNSKVSMVGILAEKARFSRRTASCVIGGLVDKIGDIKSGAKVRESMTAVAEATQLGYIADEMVSYAFNEQKNPKNQAETLNWLSQAIQEFGFTTLNVKPLIPFIKKALAAVNPQVRTAAISLIGVMYMYMGGVLRSLFESEKAALLAQIDAEFEKVAGNQPPAPFRGIKSKVPGSGNAMEDEEEDEGAEEEAGGAGAGGMNLADLVPRTDISGQITPALIEELADSKWKIRGEALEKVTTILAEAKHITPNLGELAGALKARLGDSNKLLQTTTANICATIASAMGPPVKAYVTRLAPGLFLLTADMKPTVRAAAIAALNAFEEHVGLAPFIEDEILSTALNVDKPFLRMEIFGFLAEKLAKYRTLPSDLALSVPVLFAALEDRNGDVRKQAQAALPLFMMHLDYNKMVKMTGKLKPSSKTNVCAIMEKQRPNIPEKPGKPAGAGKASKKKKQAIEEASPISEEEVEKPAAKGKRPKSAPAKPDTSSVSSSASSTSEPVANNAPSAPSTGAKKGKQPAPAAAKGKSGKTTKRGKGDEEETGPALIMNNGKDKRIKDEQDLKVLKWNFTTPRAEYIDQLKDQMQACVSKSMIAQLFHSDFKYHIQALSTLTENLDIYKDATMASLDVLLKYLTIRFFDTNTSIIMKVLQYLKAVFTYMAEEDLSLREHEASSFIPYLISKVGDNKENIRKDVRAVMRLLTKVYPSSKMFGFIMDGLKSKNSRQRTECLEELGCLIELYGINVCQPSPPKAVKEIAGQIGDRDNSVRSAALNTLVQAYQTVGEDIYKFVGNLSDKDMGMLEERIKRSAKKNPSAPAPKATPASAQQKEDRSSRADPKKSGLPNPTKSQRPGTAPSGVRNGPTSNYPKTFSLDLDKLGLERSESEPEMPKLHDTNVDEILAEPIVMPKRRLQKSPLPNIMQLNFMISQVASNDLSVSIKSLAKLDEVLKEPERNKILKDHVDQLLVATSLQLRMAFSKHMGDVASSKEVVLMCRCMVALLMSLFHSRPLAQEASKDVLCDLLNGLITVLLDDRLMAFEGGPQVMRSVNVLLVKVVENADHSNTMGALIKLLQDCAARESSAPKFVQLVMKCLWRMVRMMPNIIETLKVDRVLLDLHQFLKAFPSHSWRERASDTPLRTIKTILHSMAKILGDKILSYQTLITDPENSEMDGYLKRVLKSNRLSQGSLSSEPVNGSAEPERVNVQNGAKMSPRRAPTRTNDILAEIFKKVGSKENTREGLAELYDFKQKYPEVDIDPFLKKTSQIFQSYIERGLKSIAVERREKGLVTAPTVPKPQSREETEETSPATSPSEDEITSANVLRERIKVLRARCGLDNGPDVPESQLLGADKTEATSRSSVDDSLLHSEHHSSHHHQTNERTGRHLYNPERISLGSSSSSVPANPTPSMSDTNVEDLKKRLQRIKSSLNK